MEFCQVNNVNSLLSKHPYETGFLYSCRNPVTATRGQTTNGTDLVGIRFFFCRLGIEEFTRVFNMVMTRKHQGTGQGRETIFTCQAGNLLQRLICFLGRQQPEKAELL